MVFLHFKLFFQEFGINIKQFKQSLFAKIWSNVGRVNYRPFEEARAFVRDLGLKSSKEWIDYSKSEEKPKDIPNAPSYTYSDNGWQGLGDWLGTGTIATYNRNYKSYKIASMASSERYPDLFGIFINVLRLSIDLCDSFI